MSLSLDVLQIWAVRRRRPGRRDQIVSGQSEPIFATNVGAKQSKDTRQTPATASDTRPAATAVARAPNTLCQLRLLLISQCVSGNVHAQWPRAQLTCASPHAIGREGSRGITCIWFRRQSCPIGMLPTSRQSKMMHCWGLLGPCGVKMLCNHNRAEAVVRRYYASTMASTGISSGQMNHALTTEIHGSVCHVARLIESGAVYLCGQVCHTLTSSLSNLYWVVLPDGSRGFLSPIVILCELHGTCGHGGAPRYGSIVGS